MFSIPTKYSNKLIISYFLAIMLLTLLPLNGNDSKINHIYIIEIRLDYLAHAILYLPMGLLARTFLQQHQLMQTKILLICALGSFIFASGMEFLQFYTTWRSFNINDLLANNLGVLFGYLFLTLIKR